MLDINQDSSLVCKPPRRCLIRLGSCSSGSVSSVVSLLTANGGQSFCSSYVTISTSTLTTTETAAARILLVKDTITVTSTGSVRNQLTVGPRAAASPLRPPRAARIGWRLGEGKFKYIWAVACPDEC
jgi:hypothetical protein